MTFNGNPGLKKSDKDV